MGIGQNRTSHESQEKEKKNNYINAITVSLFNLWIYSCWRRHMTNASWLLLIITRTTDKNLVNFISNSISKCCLFFCFLYSWYFSSKSFIPMRKFFSISLYKQLLQPADLTNWFFTPFLLLCTLPCPYLHNINKHTKPYRWYHINISISV